jgi:hypothetical protein
MTLTRTHRFLTWAAIGIAPLVLAAKGCGVAVVGEECGGLAGLSCDEGQFCDFAPDASCGAADQTGTCRETPEICTLQFDPVCGCDDQTYGNACEANAAGVSVAREGACEELGEEICGVRGGAICGAGEFCSFPLEAQCGAADRPGTCEPIPEACTEEFDPVCGCDGLTHGNACSANAAGTSVASLGECDAPEGTICGGLTGASCGPREFCDFAIGDQCGAADQTGTCAPIPDACDAIFDPVCGCDDETYSSACVANAAGVSVASEGECQPSAGGTCGGLLGADCAEAEFCNFPLEAQCGAADQTGTCEPLPEICTLELNPVCGCDDQTYSNACAANSAGISVASEGACDTGGEGADCGGLLGLQCAENEFCDFTPDAFCGAADQTGTCRVKPEACILIFDPVCGCDGRTYGSRCEANSAGVSVVSEGECE